MNTTTLERTARTLIVASLMLVASACTDTLGPNADQSNGQDGQNQPTATAPGGEQKTPPANHGQPTGGYSEHGAGEDPGSQHPNKGRVAA